MTDHLQHELKKEFQLERMILFSDAIFAIAITLLVLEIKVPAFNRHTATDQMLTDTLGEMIPKFLGFLLSFMIIGAYWIIHHRIFGFVINYNNKLLSLNLLLLLGIVLMPFSTAFFSEYLLRFLKTPMLFYIINVAFLGGMNYFLWQYVSNGKNQLSVPVSKKDRASISLRTIIPSFSFIIIAVGFLLTAKFAPYFVLAAAVLIRIIRWFVKKKTSKTETKSI